MTNEFGWEVISVTKEMRKLITNDQIRKNVTKIYLVYDEEEEKEYYEIYFKEETVKSWYSDEYMTRTTAQKRSTPEKDINGWLKEIAYVGNYDFRY